uniref:Uncharacterized protein n=1 Tax=viral metagenome TaxID=1070528 RepID=A0A6C0CBH7_9ZZZZ
MSLNDLADHFEKMRSLGKINPLVDIRKDQNINN